MRSPLATLLPRPRNDAPPYASRGQTRLPWWRPGGMDAQMRAMGSVGTLFAIVDRLATSTAAPDWRMYRTPKPSQRNSDRTEVTAHAALDLLRKPNAFFTRQLLMETVQQHYDLVGEGWLIVSRHARMRSIPLELWPVSPARMTPIPDRNNYLAGYVYTSPDGEQIPLELDEVIHIRRPNPIDPYRGIGPVQTILADLEGVRLSAEWNRNFFYNSAEPGGIIQIEGHLGDTEFNELRDRWSEQHKGVANAHRVAILERGKWVDRTVNQRDMQFVELRNVSREVIREAYGIPKFAVGDVEDVNRATADAARTWFAEQMSVPRLERWRLALDTQLLPLFGATGKGVEFDYESPVPDDEQAENEALTSRANAAAALVQVGFDGAGTLEAVGLPPIPYAPPPPPAAAPPVAVDVQLGGPAMNAALASVIRDAVHDEPHRPALPAAAANDPNRIPPEDLPDISHVQQALNAALAALLAQWATIAVGWATSLAEQVRDRIAAGDRAGLAEITIPAHEVEQAAATVKAAMVRLAHDAADQVVHEAADQGVEVSAGIPDEEALGEVADVVTRNLARDAETAASNEALRLSSPSADGDAEAERVADGVKTALDDASDARARKQLGGALHGATNTGRMATLRKAPAGALYANEKNDKNTCTPCRNVNGTWLGNTDDMAMVERSYPGGAYGGYILCEGGVNCRGTITGVWRPKTTGGGA